ncbi:hypothetical protein JCM5353_006216 [Sporobolomyces roseus]
MGQGESVPSSTSHDPALTTSTAFHVLRIAENSPASEASLEPFFDFIVGINQQLLGDEIDLLTEVLEGNEGRQVGLMVYSTKRKAIRDVYVTPSRDWSSTGGSRGGEVDGEPSLLGLSLRLCNPQHALEQVWHVLEVLEGSPAQSAGLVPFGDWIIGYSGGVLRGEGDFYDVVESHTDKPLRLFVYNSDYDVTREAILVPNRTWGGEGLLGAGVGYGLLHRIPKPQSQPPPQSDPYHHQPQAPSSQQPSYQQQRSSLPPSSIAPTPAPSNPRYSAPPPRNPVAAPPQSSQYRSPPRTNSQPLQSQSQPSPSRSSQPPPPTRRVAAVSPPPSSSRTPISPPIRKYIPPPPSSSSSTRPPQTQTQSQTYTQHPSFNYSSSQQSQSQSQGGDTSISFGEYDVSEGVSIVASETGTGEEDLTFEDHHEGGLGRERERFGSYASTGGSFRQGGYGNGKGGGGAQIIAEEADE